MLKVKFLVAHGKHKVGDVVELEDAAAMKLDDQLLVDVMYAPAGGEPDVALVDLSAKDLKAKAKALGLTGYSSLSKDELIAAIEGV